MKNFASVSIRRTFSALAHRNFRILWLGAFRGANQAAVDWIERTGREPACLLLSTAYLDFAGPDPASRTASDPLLRWIEPRYEVVPQPFPEFLVMRRLGR